VNYDFTVGVPGARLFHIVPHNEFPEIIYFAVANEFAVRGFKWLIAVGG
jgi:hypothetical protein